MTEWARYRVKRVARGYIEAAWKTSRVNESFRWQVEVHDETPRRFRAHDASSKRDGTFVCSQTTTHARYDALRLIAGGAGGVAGVE